MISCSSFDDVMITTGMVLVTSFDLICRKTSIPSTLGILISSRITLGLFSIARPAKAPLAKIKSSASAPSLTCINLLARLTFLRARMVISASCGLSSTNRTSTLLSFINSGFRQAEKKCRPGVFDGFGPYLAVMFFNYPFYQCQANSRSFKIFLRMQPLENTKEFVAVGHIEPRPVILYIIGYPVAVICGADHDHRCGFF